KAPYHRKGAVLEGPCQPVLSSTLSHLRDRVGYRWATCFAVRRCASSCPLMSLPIGDHAVTRFRFSPSSDSLPRFKNSRSLHTKGSAKRALKLTARRALDDLTEGASISISIRGLTSAGVAADCAPQNISECCLLVNAR